MYVKNQNFAIYLILAVVVGFGLSFLFGGLSVQSDLLGGDVSKANRYYNQKEDPSFTVIEERLKNDGEFLDRTKGAMGFLLNRMIVLYELTEKTIEACDGIQEFQPLMTELQSMNAKAFNTAKAFSDANDGLDKMVAGRYAPEYELYSNQAYIGFSKVESQMDLGEKFCRIATSFLEGKDAGQYEQIAQLLTVWEAYCLQNSQMVADKEHAKPAADSTPNIGPLNVPGMPPGGSGPKLTGPSHPVADNRHQVDTITLINSPFPKFPPRRQDLTLGNSAFDEYLNGIAAGEVLEGINMLDAVVILEAFPGMEAVLNARIEDR